MTKCHFVIWRSSSPTGAWVWTFSPCFALQLFWVLWSLLVHDLEMGCRVHTLCSGHWPHEPSSPSVPALLPWLNPIWGNLGLLCGAQADRMSCGNHHLMMLGKSWSSLLSWCTLRLPCSPAGRGRLCSQKCNPSTGLTSACCIAWTNHLSNSASQSKDWTPLLIHYLNPTDSCFLARRGLCLILDINPL